MDSKDIFTLKQIKTLVNFRHRGHAMFGTSRYFYKRYSTLSFDTLERFYLRLFLDVRSGLHTAYIINVISSTMLFILQKSQSDNYIFI